MATTVQIAVTLDANGAVTGVKQLGDQFDNLGNKAPGLRKKHEDAFGGIESAEKKAHLAGALWTRLTGTEMPAALEKILVKSKTLGPILAGAFNAGVIIAAGVAVVGVIGNIVTWAKELGGATAELAKMKEQAIALNIQAITNPMTDAQAKKNRFDQIRVVEGLRKQADGFQNANQMAKAFAHTMAFLGDEEMQQMVDSQKSFHQQDDALKQLNDNSNTMTRSVRALKLDAQKEIDEAGKTGFALIQQQHIDEDKMARNSFDLYSGLSDALTLKLRANAVKASAATKDLNREMTQETVSLAAQTAESQLQGDAKISESISNRITAERVAFMKKYQMNAAAVDNDAQFQYRVTLITQQGEHERLEMHRQTLEKINELESEAAVASLPEWQRGRAQIFADEQKTTRELQHELDTRLINKEEFDRLTVASTLLANAKMRDENKRLTEELGSDLQSVFDDITSGNIGKRILANMEKLFFQIVAQWILSLGVMKSAAGSIFGSIVFGPGSTGANVFGGGSTNPVSLIGSVLGLGGGSSSPQSGQVAAGASGSSSTVGAFSSTAGFNLPGLSPGNGLAGATAGIGATPGSNGLFSASSALTSQTFADVAVQANSASHELGHSLPTQSGNSFLGGLKGLASLGPLGIMLASGLGGKIGQIGGGITGAALSIGPKLLSLLGVSSKIAPLILGPLAFLGAGLTGFGLGETHGGLLGSLGGAGSGALTGFLVGGPIGAVVGGIIGLLGGIFGGIFGGSKRKKQANSLADNTILPGITQVSQGFDSFQVDSSSAIQQLEQLRTDAEKQLKALKGEGTSVLNSRIEPAINDAEKHIRDTQGERDRRSATVFGPPQFDTGGMFSLMRGNAGLAVLHDGEFVMTPAATKKNRGTLEALNAGGSVGSNMQVTLNINAMDAKSFDGWAKRGGTDMIVAVLDRWSKEGSR